MKYAIEGRIPILIKGKGDFTVTAGIDCLVSSISCGAVSGKSLEEGIQEAI